MCRIICLVLSLVALASSASGQQPAANREFDTVAALERLAASDDSLLADKALTNLAAALNAEARHRDLERVLRALRQRKSGAAALKIDFLIAEAVLLAGDTAAASTAFLSIGRGAPDADQRNDRLRASALEQAATLAAARGNARQAILILEDEAARFASHQTTDARLSLARLYAANRNTRGAMTVLDAALREVADDRDSLAIRALLYEKRLLASERTWIRSDRSRLIADLKRAFARRDLTALRRLASGARFDLGILGSEGHEISLDSAFTLLSAAIPKTGVTVSDVPIRERTRKAYVTAASWNAPLSRRSLLLLRQTPFGWEWGGIVTEGPVITRSAPGNGSEQQGMTATGRGPDAAAEGVRIAEHVARVAPPSGQPLGFTLKAPWKSGKSMLSGKRAQIKFGGSCTETYGFTGNYYGQGTHSDDFDHFAIDHTVWEVAWEWTVVGSVFGIPVWGWFLVAVPVAGMEVRSVAAGIVIERDGENGLIVVQHLDAGGATNRYTSRYVHMNPIFVHTGDYVGRGTPLGKVDDKGQSTGDHLHFSVNDEDLGGNAVMQSPLNGSSRDSDGDIKCIESTNNELFTDEDSDDVPDGIDNCTGKSNPTQSDWNGDHVGDACDDSDGDLVVDANDNCRSSPNNDQFDRDGDGKGDACDSDRDGDGRSNGTDNCPDIVNADQADSDADGVGNLCDSDLDGDGWENDVDHCPANADPSNADGDNDRICDIVDNCPTASNSSQADIDGDGTGNACDTGDYDDDGIPDMSDNCIEVANNSQTDIDRDGFGDKCDPVFNVAPPPAVLEKIREFLEAEIRFRRIEQAWRNPIGPYCLTCPPDLTVSVHLDLLQLPDELVPRIYDSQGREIQTVLEHGPVQSLSFRALARQQYDLAIVPRDMTALNKPYRVRFGIRMSQ